MKAAHTKFWQTSDAILILFVPLTLLASWFLPLPGKVLLDFSWLRVAGSLLIICGLLLIGAARRQLQKQAQPAGPGKPTTELLTTGVFRLSRNPIYLGIILIYAGLGLAFTAPWFLIFAGLTVAVFNIVLIGPEEKYLAEKFGEDYEALRSSVRRWI